MKLANVIFLILFASMSSIVQADEPAPKFNIVLIVCDDLGYGEPGCYGNGTIPTPNIDSLARDGVRFRHAYSASSIGSPSRLAILTGRYPSRTGYELNPGAMMTPDVGFDLNEILLSQPLKDAGYRTAAIGKLFGGLTPAHHPNERGFDEFFGFLGGSHGYLDTEKPSRDTIRRDRQPVEETVYLTDAFTREAVGFIDRNKTAPFFLYLSYNAVHSPMEAPAKYLDRFKEIPDTDRRKFAAMLSALDDGVGAIVRKLRDEKLAEKTLLIFVSSNGGPTTQTTSRNTPLRGQKATLFEGGIRIPMLMSMPTRINGNRTIDDMVMTIDLFPTIAALTGTAVPNDRPLDGVNILPLARGENAPPPHEVLYWRCGDQWAVRKGKWKLMQNSMTAKPTLMDLLADERETVQHAEDHPEIVRELLHLRDEWVKQMKPMKIRETRSTSQPAVR